MSEDKNVWLIGVAGGSGSGKTTFARKLIAKIVNDLEKANHEDYIAVISQDSYYHDQSDKFDKDGGAVNFDHPDSIDFDLVADHLMQLKSAKTVHIPQYDFATHSRSKEGVSFPPRRVIIIDGILLFSQDPVVKILDHKIYIDCPERLRFERRLNRDVVERGRTPEGVKAQYENQVLPMHNEFVEPSKRSACDVVNVENFDHKVDEWARYILNNYLQL